MQISVWMAYCQSTTVPGTRAKDTTIKKRQLHGVHSDVTAVLNAGRPGTINRLLDTFTTGAEMRLPEASNQQNH